LPSTSKVLSFELSFHVYSVYPESAVNVIF
jgi:hypothetical protein